MDFNFLSKPVEDVDAWLTGLLDGAPLLVALGIAALLGLRHASDPDHLVAVTSLVAADDGDTRGAARLGAWWGLGHASMLALIGIPLIAFKSELPNWLERGAEKVIGVVIIVLALRVIWKWLCGDFRGGLHGHAPAERQPDRSHRHLRRGEGSGHMHRRVRSPRQAFAIGLLHGLAGTGAVVLLLLAAVPSRLEAGAALVVFAPMSMVSMATCTTVFAWLLTRRMVEPVYRAALVPMMGLAGVMFGAWYVGLG
jgi:High-affinity nickel-transport protein